MKHLLLSILLLLPLVARAQSAESDSLFAAGMEHYRQGRWEDALALFEQTARLDREQMPAPSTQADHADMWAASCWHHLGNDRKARQLEEYNYDKEPVDRRLLHRSDSLYEAALVSYREGRPDAAASNIEAGINMVESILGEGHYISFYYLEAKAYIMMYTGRDAECLAAISRIEAVIRRNYSQSNPMQTLPDYIRTQRLVALGRQSEAGQMAAAVIARMEKLGMDWSKLYASMCYVHSKILFDMGRTGEFVTAHAKLRKVAAAVYGRESDDYIGMLRQSATQFKQIDPKTTYELSCELVSIVEQREGRVSENYVADCMAAATAAMTIGKYAAAKDYASSAYKIASVHYPDNDLMVLGSRMLGLGAELIQHKTKGNVAAFQQLREEIGRRLGTDDAIYHVAKTIELTAKALKSPDNANDYADELSSSYLQLRKSAGGSNADAKTLGSDVLMGYTIAVSGHGDQGRALALAAIDTLRARLADPTAGAQAHAVIPALANVARLCRINVLRQPDSLRYTVALLERECLRLVLEQEARLDSAGSHTFMRNLGQFRETLIFTHDTLSTRQTIGQMAEAVVQKCGSEAEEYARCLELLADCHAGDAPERVPLLEQCLAIRQAYDSRLNGFERPSTRRTRKKLYRANGDNTALLGLMLEEQAQKNNYRETEPLIRLCLETGDNDRATALAMTEFENSLRAARKNKSRLGDDAVAVGYAARTVLSTYVSAARADSVPQVFAEMIGRIHDRLPAKWVYTVCNILSFQQPGDSGELARQAIDGCNARYDYFRNNSSLQAMLMARDCLQDNSYRRDYYRDKALIDSAAALVQTSDPRLRDELLLYRYGLEYSRHYDTADEYIAPRSLEAFARKVISLFDGYDDREGYEEYIKALTMLVKSLTLRVANEPEVAGQLRQSCRQLSSCLAHERRSFFGEGEAQRYCFSIFRAPFTAIILKKPAEQLFDAAEVLGDNEAIAEAGSMMVRQQMAGIKTSIIYGNSTYVQEQLDDLVATATRIAAITGRDSLAALAYDASVYCKGALLRSDKLVEKMILGSRNQMAIDLYRQLQSNRQKMEDALRSGLDADSLQLEISKLSHQMRSMAYSFGDYTLALTASWQDIRKKLRKEDAAIEFTSYSHHGVTYYCALLLRHDSDMPRLIPLCTEEQLAAATDADRLADAYTHVWAPMADLLKGVANIYFSPSGLLHKIPVEYAPTPDGLMSDIYNVYRLSNTRELLLSHSRTRQPKGLLVGGVIYDPDMEEWTSATRDYSVRDQAPLMAMRDFSLTRYASMGYYLGYLDGTKREVGDIAGMMQKDGMPVTCLTGVDATEDAFKALSGTDVSVMHIATHGFYLPASGQSAASSLLPGVARGTDEDMAMSRSGLMLAGAETFLLDNVLPEGADDGVLTARELSQMDLTKTELVVLSACESGLGDIIGDGVFGLQRGFKKAGAGSLLMSLWKVDDEATCCLMTEFYRQLLAGKSRRQALECAKNVVREQTARGWDSPQYWASFILLDGLED